MDCNKGYIIYSCQVGTTIYIFISGPLSRTILGFVGVNQRRFDVGAGRRGAPSGGQLCGGGFAHPTLPTSKEVHYFYIL